MAVFLEMSWLIHFGLQMFKGMHCWLLPSAMKGSTLLPSWWHHRVSNGPRTHKRDCKAQKWRKTGISGSNHPIILLSRTQNQHCQLQAEMLSSACEIQPPLKDPALWRSPVQPPK